MVKRPENFEDGSDETPEQAEFSKQLKGIAEQSEVSQSRPISELSTQEIERILAERKRGEAREKGDRLVDERNGRRNQFLQDLGEGLSIGEPQLPRLTVRGAEYVGIYKDGKYIGTINSEGGINGIFTDKDFQDKAYELIAKSSGKKSENREKSRVEININSGVKEVMGDNGIVLVGDKMILQNATRGELNLIDLFNDGENDSIDLEKIDNDKVILRVHETGGKVIEYTIDRGHFRPESRKVKRG